MKQSFFIKAGISLFIMAQLFCWAFLQYAQQSTKQTTSALLASSSAPLVTLILSQDQVNTLKWESSTEFEFQGMMYDVVKRQETGNQVSFLCYADEEEFHIVQSLKHFFNKCYGTEEDEKHSKRVKGKVLDLFTQTSFVWTNIAIKEKAIHSFSYLFYLPTSYSFSFYHPPK